MPVDPRIDQGRQERAEVASRGGQYAERDIEIFQQVQELSVPWDC